MHSIGHCTPSDQRGVVLITALIFLVVISLLSVASMRSSTISLRMANNEESRFSAIQAASALTEAIVASPASTPVIGDAGFSNCTAGEAGCDRYTIAPPDGYVSNQVVAGNLSARVERMTPPDKPPPRIVNSSLDKFTAASFQVTATFDRTSEGRGRARVTEGLLVLVPAQ